MAQIHIDQASTPEQNTFPCDWKGCNGTPHKEPHPYRDREAGCIEKEPISNSTHPSTYATKWWPAERHPYRKTRNRSTYPDSYRIQRHHVVPGNMVDKFKDLFENLKLVGWNINDYNSNGLNLPMYDPDIVFNDLQSHNGSHTKYDIEVGKYLKDLQIKSKDYCKNFEKTGSNLKLPEDLKDDIAKMVKLFRENILNWKPGWNLRTLGGKNSRALIFVRLSDDKAIPIYPKRNF